LKIKLIVAVSENNVIGLKNELPWDLPDDMMFFKKTTLNSSVIMGKNNFLSIPERFRPLKKRTNIILTRNTSFHAHGCIVAHNLEDAIAIAKREKKDTFIIGGGMVYKDALTKKLVDLIYLTRVHAKIKGDIFFPKLNMHEWKIIEEKFHAKDVKHKYEFTFFKLKKIISLPLSTY